MVPETRITLWVRVPPNKQKKRFGRMKNSSYLCKEVGGKGDRHLFDGWFSRSP
jgi:hypothetical protein